MLVVAVATLGAAACGDSDSSSTGTTTVSSVTKAEFRAEANRVCRFASKESPPFPGKKSGAGYVTTAADVVPYLQKVSAINRRTLEDLENLAVPVGQEASVRRLVEAQRARVKDLTAALAAARKGDSAKFTAAFQRDQKTHGPAYAKAASALGLEDCAP
jgi:hypothetical protein